MKKVQLAGKSFLLDASGVLFWPDQEIVVVADLHLEKATYFAQQGQLLPPHESLETLSKLQTVLGRVACHSLILLGDSFHDAEGFGRLDDPAKLLWEQICTEYSVTFVFGNHDGLFVPPNTIGTDVLELDGITFRHQASKNSIAEISGHHHPKASLRVRGNLIKRPCFVVDVNRIILPAFGTFTGGLDVLSKEVSDLLLPDFNVYLLGEHKLYSFPRHRLCTKL